MKSMKHIRAAVVAAGLMAVAAPADAQVIHFAGLAQGCFYTVGTCVPSGSSATVGGLTYTAGVPTFDDWTDENGFLAIGGAADNFGMFSLTNQTYNYNGLNFLLQVMFTAPPGVNTVNDAWLQGSVKTTSGGVTIHFDTTPTHLVAKDGTEFDLIINELSVSRGTLTNPRYNFVNGSVQVTSVAPEPLTVGLMATGVASLIPMYRRRRREQNETA